MQVNIEGFCMKNDKDLQAWKPFLCNGLKTCEGIIE